MPIKTRVSGIGSCPYCMGKRACHENALSTLYPVLASQWNDEKNDGLTPENISFKSSKKVWWKCEQGHEWQALVRSRTIIGSGCPVCSGRAASKEYNLLTEYPKIADEWDYFRNKKSPDEYLPYSNQEVYWVCNKCKKSWTSKIIHRTKDNTRCSCARSEQRLVPD